MEQSRAREPYIYRIPALDSGLVSSVSARLLHEDTGVTSDILNLTYEYPGILTKRRGTNLEFVGVEGETIGIFEWEKTSTQEIELIMAKRVGEEIGFHYLIGTDPSESWGLIGSEMFSDGEVDMVGFADQLVVAHSGETLMSWDGEGGFTKNLGASNSQLETFFPYDNNDLRFESVANSYEDNHIQIEFVDHVGATDISMSGDQTEEDPLVITVRPATDDVQNQKMWLFLDNPTGGYYQLGDVFGFRKIDHDATMQEIEDALKDLYGENKIAGIEASAESGKDYIIEFSGMTNSYLRINTASLEWDSEITPEPNPGVGEEVKYVPKKITATANDIITAWEAYTDLNDIVAISNVSGSNGTNTVDRMTKRSMVGGYDAVSGKFLENFRGRLVLFGDESNPNLLRGSHSGDPTLWDPHARGSNAFELFVGPDDGSRVTGVLEFRDVGLLIGKDDSLYGLFGYTRANFVVDVLDSQKGVVSHGSMGYIRPYAFFVSHDGIYRYSSGTIPENITIPIQEIFDEEVDLNRLEEVTACVIERKYIVTLPAVEGDDIVLVYYVDGERWSRWTEPAGKHYSLSRDIPRGLIYTKEDDKGVYIYGDLTGKDGAEDFPCEVSTLELSAHAPELDKYFGEVYFVFRKGEEDYTVTAEVIIDDDYTNVIANTETIPAGGKSQAVLRAVVGREGRFMTLKVSNTDGSRSFGLMSIVYTCRPQGVL